MQVSIIVATLNRADMLERLLTGLPRQAFVRRQAELVVADNGSTDHTRELVESFAGDAPMPVQYVWAPGGGKARADNAGVERSRGAILAFTDDDCLLHDDYLDVLVEQFDTARFQYGGGAIIITDPEDDKRIASTHWWPETGHNVLAPRQLLRPGWIQGANMFFSREALRAIGGFDERFGPGALFGGEDLETTCRASLAGFVGVQLHELRVDHLHGRRTGSAEAIKTIQQYDRDRGSYYANLICSGQPNAFQLWSKATFEKPLSEARRAALAREFESAARFVRHGLLNPDDRL